MQTAQTKAEGPPCRVSLVGPLRLATATGGPIALQGKRARGLLAYLLLAPGQTVSRERLAGLFWGDRGDAQAKASLRQCLLELKGALASAGDDLLVATRESVSLKHGGFACDLFELITGFRQGTGEEAIGLVDALGNLRLLEDLELRGDFGDWLDLERASFDRLIDEGLAEQLDRAMATQDWAGAKALALAWLKRDPLAEVAVASLIRAELAGGAQAAAHRHYQSFKTQLAAQLGVEPSPLVEAALAVAPESEGLAAGAVRSPSRPTVIAPDETVLAVLPFENHSPDPDLSFFCDGISEEIQRTVSNASDLKVVARASSFQFRGTGTPIGDIALALNASHLLYGSVRRSGNRLRIGAELVEAASSHAVWSDRFDGDVDDVFDLQESIAQQVARALQVSLGQPLACEVLDARTYETFLRARSILAAGDPQFDDSPKRAIPLLEAVVGLAPDHAPAWELLALSRAEHLRFGKHELAFAPARDAAKSAAERALALDPRCSGAWRALAMLEAWGAFAARERLLEQAMAATPNDPGVLTDMSEFCWGVGRFREALRFAQQASDLNPLLPAARLRAAQMRAYVGDYEQSIAMLEELHALWPGNAGILLALLNWAGGLGFPDAFRRAVGDIDRFEGWQLADLRATKAYAEAVLGNDPETKFIECKKYSRTLERTGTIPLKALVAIDHMGMADLALDLAQQADYGYILDPAGPGPSTYYPGVALGPWCTMLKSPRFIDLCDKLGLCRYWAETDHWPDTIDLAPYDFKAETRARASAAVA